MTSSFTPASALAWGAVGGAIIASGIGIRTSDSLSQAATDPITATWLAALSGAALGGAISYLLARQTSKEALRRDQEARSAEQRGQLMNALFRALYIHADLGGTVAGIKESLQKSEDIGLNTPNRWARVSPIIGRAVAQPINPSELSALVEDKEFDLVGRYCELLMKHDALLQTQALYEKEWLEVSAMMPSTVLPTGALSSGLTEAQRLLLTPRFTRLNGMAISLEQLSGEHYAAATKVIQDIGTVGQRRFGKSFPKYRAVPDAE